MLHLEGIKARIDGLERVLSKLEGRSKELNRILSSYNQTKPGHYYSFEKRLLTHSLEEEEVTPLPPSNHSNEEDLNSICNLLHNHEYENLLLENEFMSKKFQKNKLKNGETINDHLSNLTLSEKDGSFKLLCTGICLLQLYIQANWTGPPVNLFQDKENYPLKYLPREDELINPEIEAKLSLELKSLQASTGQDSKTMNDIDMFPKTHEKCRREMEINGELLVEQIKGLQFLQASYDIFSYLYEESDDLITTGWWFGRCLTAYQESLQTRVVAHDLKTKASQAYEQVYQKIKDYQDDDEDSLLLLPLLDLERGVSSHKFQDPNQAKEYFIQAVKGLELKIELSGAMGKRTKFQIEDKSQLILLASSKTTRAAASTSKEEKIKPEEGKFGTVKEAGHVKVQLEELDEETPLHERIQFQQAKDELEAKQRHGHLSQIDQVAVLNMCIDVKNSYAQEGLTSEQMLAYVERVTQNPDNWTIHGCALLIKSKLEFEKYKTKERSVLQMQLLVDQQSDRLTPLQFRLKDIQEDSAKPKERLQWVHALVWPPVWRLKRGLADRYRELGVLAHALQLYQELRIWEDACNCLVSMDKRARAEQLVKERILISPSPYLYVVLGELTKDESLLEKAWEVSNHRYARAKRLLGSHCYERGELEKATEHFMLALEVNAHFAWAWFRLGAIFMRLSQWEKAKKAFAQLVRVEPTDAEGWANLSACLSQLNDVTAAFKAIQEATRYGYSNSRMWDSSLTLSIQAKEWDVAIFSLETLIELEASRGTAPEVDPRALLSLANQALQNPLNFGNKFNRLIEIIKSKTKSTPDVWAIIAEYYSSLGLKNEKREALFRRLRALLVIDEWFKDAQIVHRVTVTSRTLLNDALRQEDLEASAKRDIQEFLLNWIQRLVGNSEYVDPENIEKAEQLREALKELV